MHAASLATVRMIMLTALASSTRAFLVGLDALARACLHAVCMRVCCKSRADGRDAANLHQQATPPSIRPRTPACAAPACACPSSDARGSAWTCGRRGTRAGSRSAIRMQTAVRGEDAVLWAEGLTKTWDGIKYQLNGVDLVLTRGERAGLVGANGCGKSTLLRLLAGKDDADAGRVQARRGLVAAYVEQEPEFPPGSSIASVMYAGESPVMRTLLEYDPGKKVGPTVSPSRFGLVVSASGTASMPPAAYDTENAATCKVPTSSSARTNEAIIRSFPGRTLTVTVLLNDPIQQQAA